MSRGSGVLTGTAPIAGARGAALLALFLAAVLVRLAFARIEPGLSISPDMLDRYEPIARSLLAGDGFSFKPGTPTLESAPIYPLLIAAVYGIFGESHFWLRVVLAIFDGMAELIAYPIAAGILGRRAGILAVAILALYPPLIFFVGILQPEPVFGFFHILFLLFLLRAIRSQESRSYLLAGIWLGLAILTRSAPLLLPLFLGIAWLLPAVRGKSSLRHIAVLIVAAYAIIAPWTVRNHMVSHEFVPVQILAGRYFWMGTYRDQLVSSPNNERYVLVNQRMQEIIPPGTSEAEGDRILLRAGLRRVKTDPLNWLSLLPLKFARFWYASDSGKYDAMLAAMQSILFVLGATGFIRFVVRNGWTAGGPLLAVAAYYAAFHTVAHPLARYSMVLAPLGAVFAAYALVELWRLRPARFRLAAGETAR